MATTTSTYMGPPALPSDLERILELWFEDGTLVLQAEASLFKVYKGMLALKSPVFSDMLSIPQPDDIETVEGCPIVRLPDSASDTKCFLQAIHDPEFYGSMRNPIEFSVVAGILRLSTKYDVRFLRKHALTLLSAAFPMSPRSLDFPSTLVTPTENLGFAVLPLARQLDIPWLVLAATYVCSRAPLRDILDGVTFDGAHVDLDWESKRACVVARSALIEARHEFQASFSRTIPDCRYQSTCARIKAVHIHRSRTEHPGTDGRYDSTYGVWQELSDLCETCLSDARNVAVTGQSNFWNAQLPKSCGLSLPNALERRDEALR